MTLAASVIIPTRNRADIIGDCLPTVLDQDLGGSDYEVIVVVDDSPDHTAELLAGINHPRLRWEVLPRTAPGAISRTRNRAIALAKADIIISLDDDAYVARNYIATHLARQKEGPNRIVTGPIIEINAPPTDIARAAKESAKGWHRNPYPSGNASAPKALFDRIGGYDEEFTLYGWEDMEFATRLLKAGAKRFYDSAAAILHYKPSSAPRSFRDRLIIEIQRGTMGALFHKKHPSLAVAAMTKRLGLLQGIDAGLNALLGLDGRLDRVLAGEADPASALMRFLLKEHAEISGPRLRGRLDTLNI
ncbi:MAG: glycosyltransferase [Pseudomonadota bacterium]